MTNKEIKTVDLKPDEIFPIYPDEFNNTPKLINTIIEMLSQNIKPLQLFVNNLPIVIYSLVNRYFDIFAFLIEISKNVNYMFKEESLLLYTYKLAITNGCSIDYLEVLFKNGVNPHKKDCFDIIFTDYIIDNFNIDLIQKTYFMEMLLDLINKYYPLNEFNFTYAIKTTSIWLVDNIFERTKYKLTELSISIITSLIPNLINYYNFDLTSYKRKFILQIQSNLTQNDLDGLYENVIEDVDVIEDINVTENEENTCIVCYDAKRCTQKILDKVYPNTDKSCPSRVHNCNHDIQFCLSCLERTVYENCPMCRAKSIL